MKKIYAIFLFIFLTACATAEKYNAMVMQYMHITESQLINTWGIPDNTYEMGENDKIFSYIDEESGMSPGTPAKQYTSVDEDGNVVVKNEAGTMPTPWHTICTTDFRITNGVVVNISFRGNGCVSD